MFQRFNWLMFDRSLFHEDPSGRLAKAKQLGTSWSAWTDLARQYRERFAGGDERAIVEFARRSKGAFLALWVIKALRRWQAEGTVTGKRKIRNVITAWLDSRGRARPEQLFATIRRDKQIACEVLRLRIKEKTVEEAVFAVAEKRRVAEETVREIHRKYSSFNRRTLKRSKREFLAYLQQADPAKVWERVMEGIDGEQTALFLYLEVKAMIARGQSHFEDLHPGWPPPGDFFDSLVGGVGPGQRATLTVSASLIPEGSAVSRALSPAAYLRIDVYRDILGTGQQPDETFFWEKMDDHFLHIPPAQMAWYEDLKKTIR